MIPDDPGFSALAAFDPGQLFGFAVKLLDLPTQGAYFLYDLRVFLSQVVRHDIVRALGRQHHPEEFHLISTWKALDLDQFAMFLFILRSGQRIHSPVGLGAARIIASGYFAYSAELVGKAAGVLGCAAEKTRYRSLAAEARAAFVREYITPAGRMVSDTETAYAVDETDRPTGRPQTRPEEVAHYNSVGSGSPGITAGGRPRETGAERLLLNRAWCEENSWNEAGSEHVSPRTPALQGLGVSGMGIVHTSIWLGGS